MTKTPAKCHFLYVKKGLLNAYVFFLFRRVVRFNKNVHMYTVFLASFLIKFDDINSQICYGYTMRIQS